MCLSENSTDWLLIQEQNLELLLMTGIETMKIKPFVWSDFVVNHFIYIYCRQSDGLHERHKGTNEDTSPEKYYSAYTVDNITACYTKFTVAP